MGPESHILARAGRMAPPLDVSSRGSITRRSVCVCVCTSLDGSSQAEGLWGISLAHNTMYAALHAGGKRVVQVYGAVEASQESDNETAYIFIVVPIH